LHPKVFVYFSHFPQPFYVFIPTFNQQRLSDLINRMLIVDPSSRITLEEVLLHPWMRGPVLSDLDLFREMQRRTEFIRASERLEAANRAAPHDDQMMHNTALVSVNTEIDTEQQQEQQRHHSAMSTATVTPMAVRASDLARMESFGEGEFESSDSSWMAPASAVVRPEALTRSPEISPNSHIEVAKPLIANSPPGATSLYQEVTPAGDSRSRARARPRSCTGTSMDFSSAASSTSRFDQERDEVLPLPNCVSDSSMTISSSQSQPPSATFTFATATLAPARASLTRSDISAVSGQSECGPSSEARDYRAVSMDMRLDDITMSSSPRDESGWTISDGVSFG
jgi:serine/threonine protein kinase